MDFHFYDEVYAHRTIPENFQKYFPDLEKQHKTGIHKQIKSMLNIIRGFGTMRAKPKIILPGQVHSIFKILLCISMPLRIGWKSIEISRSFQSSFVDLLVPGRKFIERPEIVYKLV